jgi:hypothetical protein
MLDINQKEKVMFFNVDFTRLKKALDSRGFGFTRNKDGTVSVDGNVFRIESDLLNYIEIILRKDSK